MFDYQRLYWLVVIPLTRTNQQQFTVQFTVQPRAVALQDTGSKEAGATGAAAAGEILRRHKMWSHPRPLYNFNPKKDRKGINKSNICYKVRNN